MFNRQLWSHRPFGYRTFSLVTKWLGCVITIIMLQPFGYRTVPITEWHSAIGQISTIRLPDMSGNQMPTVFEYQFSDPFCICKLLKNMFFLADSPKEKDQLPRLNAKRTTAARYTQK